MIHVALGFGAIDARSLMLSLCRRLPLKQAFNQAAPHNQNRCFCEVQRVLKKPLVDAAVTGCKVQRGQCVRSAELARTLRKLSSAMLY